MKVPHAMAPLLFVYSGRGKNQMMQGEDDGVELTTYRRLDEIGRDLLGHAIATKQSPSNKKESHAETLLQREPVPSIPSPRQEGGRVEVKSQLRSWLGLKTEVESRPRSNWKLDKTWNMDLDRAVYL